MVDGNKEFLKELCFVFRRGILCTFRVEYNERLVGIKLKRYLGFLFSKTSSNLEGTPIPILDRFFLLMYPLLLLLRLDMGYIE